MKLVILAVGKGRSAPEAMLAESWMSRIHSGGSIIEVESKLPSGPDRQCDESARLLRHVDAGIPFAALVAERMGLPMSYIRKKPKGYGRNARIEGNMFENQNVLLVEDLTTDGGSKLSFVEAIRESGAKCSHTAVIFNYGIFHECFPKIGNKEKKVLSG